ncbi:MAG: hypothetical protein HOO93_10265 [Methyloglobulus sp.]|nr:hypothetical protein [Methyloglobulus sp.]
MTNLDTSSILTAIDEHLEAIRNGMAALAAANEGLCAAISSEAPLSADGIGSLFDIVLGNMKGHTEAIQAVLSEAQ